MIAIVIITSLLAILTIFISSIIYLVSLIIESDGDPEGNPSHLALDGRDFSSSPVITPNDDHSQSTSHASSSSSVGLNRDNTLRRSSSNLTTSHKESKTQVMAKDECHCTRRKKELLLRMLSENNDTTSQTTDKFLTKPEPCEPLSVNEIQSALMNSQILKLGRNQPAKSVESSGSIGLETDVLDGNESQTLATKSAHESQAETKWKITKDQLKDILINRYGAKICEQIIEDFDEKDMSHGGTALHWCKNRSVLDKLVHLGMPLEAKNKRNETALHVAVSRHKLQVLIGLLCHKADVESKNEVGDTPLLSACKVNNIFACQMLLVFDANFDVTDRFGRSARHYSSHACFRHRSPENQLAPKASHLILAMLDAIGAKRCPASPTSAKDPKARHNSTHNSIKNCSDGCSASGSYNGNSYDRWINYNRESLYKRHMFSDIIESRLKQSKFSRVWRWNTISDGQQKSRLLSIDGGGLRGVIVCQIMIEVEKYLKRPMIEYFDWVGGTSVGGFLACALSLGKSTSELRRICFDVKDEVFSGQKKPYSSKFIERVLRRTYGSDTRMSDIRNRKLAITATLADRDPCQLRFFRNYKSPAQLLESQGYAAETFNNMSSHSIVTQENAGKESSSMIPTDEMTYPFDPLNYTASSDDKVIKTITMSTKQSAAQQRRLAQSKDSTTKSIIDYDDFDDLRDGETQALSESDTDPYVWQAVRASAAAPYFFKPYGPFLDGGIISNNPTLDLLAEFESYQRVRAFLKKKQQVQTKNALDLDPTSKLDLVVSLGTGRGRVIGRQAMIDFSQVASGFATVFSPVELVRSIKSARELFRKLIRQSCHTEDHIVDRAQAWCSSLSVPYFRISPPLATIFSIDDKRDEQLINALWQTKLYMKSMRGQLQELAQILDGAI